LNPEDYALSRLDLLGAQIGKAPRRLGNPYVFVNIPGFGLELVRDGVPVWRTRIVVGKAFTPTPVFSDRIVAVVVNPPWNVPQSIALGEYLRELRKDPRAFKRRGLRLLEGSEPTTSSTGRPPGRRGPYVGSERST